MLRRVFETMLKLLIGPARGMGRSRDGSAASGGIVSIKKSSLAVDTPFLRRGCYETPVNTGRNALLALNDLTDESTEAEKDVVIDLAVKTFCEQHQMIRCEEMGGDE